MKNYAIDTALLPEVWVTWYGKDGRIWMNDNGARYNHPMCWMSYENEHSFSRGIGNDNKVRFGSHYSNRNSDRLWVNAGSILHYAYAKYHEDIDRLELAAVKYDTTRSEGKHTWHYAGDRIFIAKDKSVIDQNGQCRYFGWDIKKGSTDCYLRDALRGITRLTANDHFIDEFKKFLGHNYFIMGNGASEYVEYNWHINKWYDTVQKKRTEGKAQKLVDELVAMPLGEISRLAYKYPPKPRDNAGYYESNTIDNVIYFERVNDKWSVLRALIRNSEGKFDEGWRVYLGDDGTNRIAANSYGDWVPASQNKGWHSDRQYYFANKEEALEKCDRIKYIAPIMASAKSIDALITTLRFPSVEQLYKLGQKGCALSIAKSHQPKAYMKEIFGYYNDKEKNILRQVAMTKHQLDAYFAKRNAEQYGYSSQVINKLRETLGNDLSHIDNATFDKYLDAFDAIFKNYWSGRNFDMLDVDKSRFWKNVVRLNSKNPNAARLIADTADAYNRLRWDGAVEVDWFFDDYSDIVRTHDALTALVNQREAERRAYYNMAETERRKKDDEKRKKVDENRKQYEYEDENFIIRLPKDVYEIINEGTKQSICIGGYTGRHSNGETNLFFLRKKDDENTPFYAIEMANNKNIIQIHGHCNKWLGNNPEAIPTVVRWLRKHDIKCDEKILTCTAKGYGRINEYIEMPQVD